MNLPHRTTAPRHAVLYFDFADPESYLAAERIPRACRASATSLTLEPVSSVVLGGAPVAPAAAVVERARALRVPLRVREPFDAEPCLRACLAVRDRSGQDAMAALAERFWHALWRDGLDLSAADALVRAAGGSGVPEAVLRAALEDPRTGEMLQRVTRRAAQRGVRQLPAVQIEDELFVGLERVTAVEERLAGRERPDGDEASGPNLPDWFFSG